MWRAGLKVPCALPGAELPGDFKIKVAKVRGIESSGHAVLGEGIGDRRGCLRSARSAGRCACRTEHSRIPRSRRSPVRAQADAEPRRLLVAAWYCARSSGPSPVLTANLPVVPEVRCHASPTARRSCWMRLTLARFIVAASSRASNAKAPTPEWMKRRLERSGYPLHFCAGRHHQLRDARTGPAACTPSTTPELNGAVHARLAKPGEQLLLLNEQTVAVDCRCAGDRRRCQRRWPWPASWAARRAGSPCDTSELFLESAFFAPNGHCRPCRVATASAPMHRTVSSAASILVARVVPSSVPPS